MNLTSTDSAGTKHHLLVVDDEGSVRSLVKMMGEHLGYVVLEAVNGADALTQLQSMPGEIEVVLTDINMPVMDGLTMIQAIKKMAVRPAIAVMSGRFESSIHTSLLAEGVTVLLNKPFSTDELSLTLSQARTAPR